jgi:hypothetical protein
MTGYLTIFVNMLDNVAHGMSVSAAFAVSPKVRREEACTERGKAREGHSYGSFASCLKTQKRSRVVEKSFHHAQAARRLAR